MNCSLRLDGGTTAAILRAQHPFLGAQFSPDGRWVAYASEESGQLEIYVTDYPAGQVERKVSIDGGSAPVWARNGRELYYVSGTAMMAAAVRSGASSGEFERPIRLFDGVDLAVGNVTTYSVATDGRFLFVEEADSDATGRNQITLVLNWFQELRRLAPIP
jgi:Tol biopolymer transport system component